MPKLVMDPDNYPDVDGKRIWTAKRGVEARRRAFADLDRIARIPAGRIGVSVREEILRPSFRPN